jgi:hypothetical protein
MSVGSLTLQTYAQALSEPSKGLDRNPTQVSSEKWKRAAQPPGIALCALAYITGVSQGTDESVLSNHSGMQARNRLD